MVQLRRLCVIVCVWWHAWCDVLQGGVWCLVWRGVVEKVGGMRCVFVYVCVGYGLCREWCGVVVM